MIEAYVAIFYYNYYVLKINHNKNPIMKNEFQEKFDSLRLYIKTCKTYNEKLNKWAQFTVEYCHDIAINKIDRSFFAFQSDPKVENPEIIILGLNPQNTYSYKSQYENEGWGLTELQKMTPDVFLQQNPWYIGGHKAVIGKEWNILKNLNKTIVVQKDLSLLFDKMIYMNILYFNSTDFSEFKSSFKEHWKEVYENNVQLSALLIFEIIKPKRILCLGIDNCFRSFIGNSPTEEIIKGSLYKCKKNGYDVYGMTHPSARKSNISRENIGWHLYAEWFNKQIFNSTENKISTIKNILSEIAEKYQLQLDFDRNKLANQYGVFNFKPYKEQNISFSFEFQKSFYSDLRYELRKIKFLVEAKKCVPPYDDWMILDENFDHEDFKNYFDGIVKTLTKNYQNYE